MKQSKKIQKMIILVFLLCVSDFVFSQEIKFYKDNSEKIIFEKISKSIRDSIVKYIDHTFHYKSNIEYFTHKNKFYLFYKIKKEFCVGKYQNFALFCIDTNINSFNFFQSTITDRRDVLYEFNFKDYLYLIIGKDNRQSHSYTSIFRIDSNNLIKEFVFKQQDLTLIAHDINYKTVIYSENNLLKMVINSYKSEFSIWWLFFYWAPRGEPRKWDYDESSLIRYLYIFDENFNCISTKEIETKRKNSH